MSNGQVVRLVIGLFLVGFIVANIPDVVRYLRISNM
jgi:hypothetical protein